MHSEYIYFSASGRPTSTARPLWAQCCSHRCHRCHRCRRYHCSRNSRSSRWRARLSSPRLSPPCPTRGCWNSLSAPKLPIPPSSPRKLCLQNSPHISLTRWRYSRRYRRIPVIIRRRCLIRPTPSSVRSRADLRLLWVLRDFDCGQSPDTFVFFRGKY